ncbi:TcpD family membrane protein [Streptomyces nanshensis]|uniref:Uncharacterized protein n=1 Tax=Streptomyces nanshensis TaxID=518642 RepID=A0A1E7LBY7_9ACTN|nr:TcpD family membrane protein [Streptomyces nanshensis]OEV13742.1 hypothetical protein AN218_02080 [Streptomyces nanshensis]
MQGNELTPWVLTIIGSLFGLFLVARVFINYAKGAWGKFVTDLAGAAIVAYVIAQPSEAIDILTAVGDKAVSIIPG